MLTRVKKLGFSLCLLGLSATGWSQVVLVKTEKNIEEYRLDNGFRVVLAPNAQESKVFVNTIYLTGSLNDPQGKGGLAHLLEHLAFKGTQDVKGEEFQRRLDQYTLMTNASTDYYSTRYTNIVRPDSQSLNEILYLESQRMDKLVLQERFVPSEIEIVKREREIRMDQPFSILMDQVFKSAYGNQYLGRLPIGDLPELKSINMNELNQFYKAWYAPNNAVMVISGKFDKAAVLKSIDQHFSSIAPRKLPSPAQVPQLDPKTIQPREFLVKKGSDLARFNLYVGPKNAAIQPALALIPGLYTLQPSGHLYQNMVETGLSTQVQASTWLDQDFNLVFIGAIYAPTHNAEQIKMALNSQVEQSKNFDQVELDRIKTLTKHQLDQIMSDAVALGSRLSDYVVSSSGQWGQFFKDNEQLQQLSTEQLNSTLKQFLTPEQRLAATIEPTAEDQKKAREQAASQSIGPTLDQQHEPVEPLKDSKVYRQEVQSFLQASAQQLSKVEQKIQRGQLKNGMRYALFPTQTRDDRVYVTINLNFGNEKSLFNQEAPLDLASYLLLRGSDQYTLQQIADKSIEAGGSATASSSGDSMQINIQARKEKFADYFKFIVDVMKAPAFEQSQFDLIRSQSLASLDRPYTEPEVVASLELARLIEIYQPGDIRYHFEPELAKKQLNAVSNSNVKQAYNQFFAMNHAQISITGDFQTEQVKQILNSSFSTWSNAEPYSKIRSNYRNYPAQRVHALSEQREFGSYQSIMTVPVGTFHPDAPALIVFAHILGNSQLSSRLAQELREKNALVYGFSSGLNLDSDQDIGALTISANYTPGRGEQVAASVQKVLNSLIQKGVTEQELEAAKADIMKKRVTALDDDRNIHYMLNDQLERQKTMRDRALRDQAIAKLTKADVDRVIGLYIQPKHLVEVMADQYGQPVSAKKQGNN